MSRTYGHKSSDPGIKTNQTATKAVLVPCALMETFMLKHGVCYGQTMTWVLIREIFPPSYFLNGNTVITQVNVEVLLQ